MWRADGTAGLQARSAPPVHPRTRGADARLTPSTTTTRAVHPHTCGANPRIWCNLPRPSTVHPHRYGAAGYADRVSSVHTRGIPTRVGQTPQWSVIRQRQCAVHPHSCGADSQANAINYNNQGGSSPHTWGQKFHLRHSTVLPCGSSPLS